MRKLFLLTLIVFVVACGIFWETEDKDMSRKNHHLSTVEPLNAGIDVDARMEHQRRAALEIVQEGYISP